MGTADSARSKPETNTAGAGIQPAGKPETGAPEAKNQPGNLPENERKTGTTGLLSEEAFFRQAQKRIDSLREPMLMVAIDIRHYKLFRELNGFQSGRQLLQRFGNILKETAEKNDGLAGYRGQDDFCLMVPKNEELIQQTFERLKSTMDSLSQISGFCPIFGLCLVENHGESAQELFNRAALTAERIKNDPREHIQTYNPMLRTRALEEFRLLADFQEAIRKGEILFYLQPQCRISTGQIVGAESLARWRREDGSFVSPGVFVPLLEKYGIVTSLDTYIWEAVCAWLRRALDAGLDPVPVSVNISRIDVFTIDVPALIKGLVRKYELPTELLKIEMTESAYVEDEGGISSMISELREAGFQVLMDDFGSGYSSLNMLKSINVDVIKLDAKFLHFNEMEEQKGISILESVVNMARSLGLPIIVEGVESQELVNYLVDLGCRYLQGYYFYRPMPVEQFEALLKDQEKIDRKGIIIKANQQMHMREFMDEHIFSDAMLNNILGPVAFYSRCGEDIDIVRFNHQFYRMVHLDADELEQRRYHIQNFFYPPDLPAFHDMLDRAEQDHINGGSGMFRIYNPNGSLFWIQVQVYFLSRDGDRSVFYASTRDMTEMQYVSIDLPGGYYRCSLSNGFEFLYLSDAFLNMFGYTREDIAQRFDNRLINMVHPRDREGLLRQSEASVRDGQIEIKPYRIQCSDGSYRYVQDQSRVTDRFGELCWQSVIVDITEVMRLRNRMRLLEKYSTDCIAFVHRNGEKAEAEVAAYGLQDILGVSEEEFSRALNDGRFATWTGNRFDLNSIFQKNAESVGKMNGVYSLELPDGRRERLVIKYSLVPEDRYGVECIISFSPVVRSIDK